MRRELVEELRATPCIPRKPSAEFQRFPVSATGDKRRFSRAELRGHPEHIHYITWCGTVLLHDSVANPEARQGLPALDSWSPGHERSWSVPGVPDTSVARQTLLESRTRAPCPPDTSPAPRRGKACRRVRGERLGDGDEDAELVQRALPGRFWLGACWNRPVEAVKTRKKREKTEQKWARYGL